MSITMLRDPEAQAKQLQQISQAAKNRGYQVEIAATKQNQHYLLLSYSYGGKNSSLSEQKAYYAWMLATPDIPLEDTEQLLQSEIDRLEHFCGASEASVRKQILDSLENDPDWPFNEELANHFALADQYSI